MQNELQKKKIRVGIVGYGGKLASRIINILSSVDNIIVSQAIVSKRNKMVGKKLSDCAEYTKNLVIISNEVNDCANCDVIIDATNRDAFLENYECYKDLTIPMIIATTGFRPEDNNKIRELSNNTKVIQAANFSFELQHFIKAVESYVYKKRILDVTIIEKHHNRKKDAPSGTAIEIKEAIEKVNSKLKVNIISIRCGTILGEHSVFLTNNFGEEIIFTHKVTSRDVFAEGIVKVIPLLLNKENGLYAVKDFV